MTNIKILVRDALKSSTKGIVLGISFLKDCKEKVLQIAKYEGN